MPKKMFLIYLCFFSIFQVSAGDKWLINKDHSHVNFTVPYMQFSEVSGRFLRFQGSMDYNRKEDSISNIYVELDVKSIFTGNKMRDQHLRENDFFAVEHFPKIGFKGKKVKYEGYNITVIGDLSMHGVTKEVTFKGKRTELQKDTWGYENMFFTLKGKINREDFDLQWNKTLEASGYLVGREVEIDLAFQMQPQGRLTPFSKHKIPDTKVIRLREKLSRGEISREEYVELSGEKPAFEIIKETRTVEIPTYEKKESVSSREKLDKVGSAKGMVDESKSHKYGYILFERETFAYYLSSMFLGILALFGTISLFKMVSRSFENTGLKYTLHFLLCFSFFLCSYIVTFDDFMQFSIAIFK